MSQSTKYDNGPRYSSGCKTSRLTRELLKCDCGISAMKRPYTDEDDGAQSFQCPRCGSRILSMTHMNSDSFSDFKVILIMDDAKVSYEEAVKIHLLNEPYISKAGKEVS